MFRPLFAARPINKIEKKIKERQQTKTVFWRSLYLSESKTNQKYFLSSFDRLLLFAKIIFQPEERFQGVLPERRANAQQHGHH